MDSSDAASGEHAVSAPVDLVHLARHTFGDRALEEEVLRLFARQSRHWMERLKEARDAGQRSEAAHTIKGSARGIGAWHVAELAERLESDSQAMSERLSGDLEAAIGETNAFIQDLLGADR